jgi:hypothetical protein
VVKGQEFEGEACVKIKETRMENYISFTRERTHINLRAGGLSGEAIVTDLQIGKCIILSKSEISPVRGGRQSESGRMRGKEASAPTHTILLYEGTLLSNWWRESPLRDNGRGSTTKRRGLPLNH